jgi:hypothetical protein
VEVNDGSHGALSGITLQRTTQRSFDTIYIESVINM